MVLIPQLQARRVELLLLLAVVVVAHIIQIHPLQRVQVVVQVEARQGGVLPPQEVRLLPQGKVLRVALATKKMQAVAVARVELAAMELAEVEMVLMVVLD
jgi:hypothetical protein